MVKGLPQSFLESSHSEIIIIALIVLIGYLWKLYRSERAKHDGSEIDWKRRIEGKLDIALDSHNRCRETLHERFVSRKELKDIMEDLSRERMDAWSKFESKFEAHISKFWNHLHDKDGSVKRAP